MKKNIKQIIGITFIIAFGFLIGDAIISILDGIGSIFKIIIGIGGIVLVAYVFDKFFHIKLNR